MNTIEQEQYLEKLAINTWEKFLFYHYDDINEQFYDLDLYDGDDDEQEYDEGEL